MKLSSRDIKILETFSTINPSMQFLAGKEQKTVSPTKSVLMKAKLDTEFDRDFAIYELGRLLRMINLVDDHEIDLHDQYLVIRSPNTMTKYYYCAPQTIFSRNNLKSQNDPLLNQDLQFVLTGTDYQKIMKAIGSVGVREVAVVGDEGKLFLESHDSNKRIRDNFRIQIGEASGTMRYIFSADNLKLIPGDYAVTIDGSGKSRFEGLTGSATQDIVYWIAMTGE